MNLHPDGVQRLAFCVGSWYRAAAQLTRPASCGSDVTSGGMRQLEKRRKRICWEVFVSWQPLGPGGHRNIPPTILSSQNKRAVLM